MEKKTTSVWLLHPVGECATLDAAAMQKFRYGHDRYGQDSGTSRQTTGSQ